MCVCSAVAGLVACMALCGVLGVFSMALWFDFRLFYTMGYTCIGLLRSGRSVACCGSSAVLSVFGSVWRFKPFRYVVRSGIPSKRFGLCMVKIKPLHGVPGCDMLYGCSVFSVVPLCGVPGIIAQSPVSGVAVCLAVWYGGRWQGCSCCDRLRLAVLLVSPCRRAGSAGGWWHGLTSPL